MRDAYEGAFSAAKVKAGDKYLGGYIGYEDGRALHTAAKVQTWTRGLNNLARVAEMKPQAHYRCLTSFALHWSTYYQRTVVISTDELNPLEEAVRLTSIPSITGQTTALTDSERKMLELPARKGGLGILNVSSTAEPNYKTAQKATSHLSGALIGKWKWSITDHLSKFAAARAAHRKLTDGRAEVFAKVLLAQEGPDSLPLPTKRAFKRAYEHHTSGWLTAVPLREQGLALSADEFRDGLALRYGWEPANASRLCNGCNVPLTMEHAQKCEVGPYRIKRHDGLKELLANCLKQATTEHSVNA